MAVTCNKAPHVNVNNGKHSYVVLIDSAGGFKNTTKVTKVKGKVTGAASDFDMKGKAKFIKADQLQIRLGGQGHALKSTLPDTGQVTITLNDLGTLNPIDVTFVDDDETGADDN